MLRTLLWFRSSGCLAQSQVAVAAASVCSPICSFAQTGSQQQSIKPLGGLPDTRLICTSSSNGKWGHKAANAGKQQQSCIQQLQQASTGINSVGQYLQQQLQLGGCQPSTASLHSVAAGDAGSPPGAQLEAASSSSSSSAAEQSKAITRLIRDASNIEQLQALIQQHQTSFNAINVAAALTRAQALTHQDHGQQHHQQQQQQQLRGRETAHTAAVDLPPLLQQQLTDLWLQQLLSATPRELANVLLACSKLSMFEPRLWGSTLAALLQELGSANDQDASTAAYALATAAAANGGTVPGFTVQEVQAIVLTLFDRVHELAMTATSGPACTTSSSSSSGDDKKASRRRVFLAGPQAISSSLWSLARLGVQPSKQQLVEVLRALAKPRVLAAAEPLALVNTFWALSELQQLPGWGPRADGVRTVLGTTAAEKAGSGSDKIKSQQPLRMLPIGLLSEHECRRLAGSSPQAVSNTILALSRFATGPQPHLLGVPAAQACIEQLLKGPTAANLSKWNAQDVGNAVYAVAQVGAIEPAFMQAVLTSAPLWLAEAGPATVAQVALGLARLKLRHATDLLEALVLRGKYLLLQHQHHDHNHHHKHKQPLDPAADARGPANSSSGGSSSSSSVGDGAWQQEQQQQQHMCECLATDLSWSIAVLNQTQLAKEVQELIRVSGIKQESSLHTKNARRLWTVHAWLVRHKLAGGHGLQRLLTEQQLADCAAANRHVHRLTPPPGLQ